MDTPTKLELVPIGVAHTPHPDRGSAPRQPRAAHGVAGIIELYAGHNYEDALSDLEQWDHIWVLFWFHLNANWKPRVQPPRSTKKRGVFSTRAPYRPNPIGMSVLKLESVEGLRLHVADVDLVDGTPILDIKPYIAYADAIPEAGNGWIASLEVDADGRPEDPEPGFAVELSDLAKAQIAFLQEHGVDLAATLTKALSLGPQPHAYRRIKKDGDALRIAIRDWRARFSVDGRRVVVLELFTGYRPRDLAMRQDRELDIHRAFVARFG